MSSAPAPAPPPRALLLFLWRRSAASGGENLRFIPNTGGAVAHHVKLNKDNDRPF